jgi:ABC-type sugar transport system ATPase subunit
MASIDIVDLNKDFGGHRVLKNVNLSIADGEFVALVGPSGCGKSTLLRIIAGLEPVSSGSVVFDGTPVNAQPPQARNVAMVFQSYALYPHMRVRDNVAFGLRQKHLPAAEIKRRVADAAKVLGLEPYLDRYPRELSGGQRQRVAMGRAMVREPVAFLLDEPLSNLDAQLRASMRAEIRALQRRLGVTTIYVTHDQVEAMTLADRIAFLNGGEIMQVADALDLYDRPANRFVAGFIGSPAMNFIAGRRSNGGVLTADGSVIALPLHYAHAEGDLILGLRPEHLSIHPDTATGRPALDGIVCHVEHLGAETELYAESCGTRLCLRYFGRQVPPIGARIRVGYDPARLHLFDGATERRIAEQTSS